MASLREQISAEFAKVDTDKTGMISQSQLESLLKGLGPFEADEIKAVVAKLDVDQEGNVKFESFLDVFCDGPKKKALKPELAKPLTPEQRAALQEAFDKFDKDKSGSIDLSELQAMCEDLGKKLPPEQAAAAMQQLDKNGDQKCCFDEFVLWFQSAPNLGGYSHVALGFMKAKLAATSKVKKAMARIARAKASSSDEFAFKGSFDITPDATSLTPSSEDCGANIRVHKTDAPNNETPTVALIMMMKDPDAAADFLGVYETCKTDENMGPPLSMFEVQQDKERIIFKASAPPGMFGDDEALTMAVTFFEEAVKKCEGRVTLGTSFDDILNNPDKPIALHFKGAKVSNDVLVNLTKLAAFFSSMGELPPEAEAGLKVMAAITEDIKIGFNHGQIMNMASIAINASTFGGWRGVDTKARMVFGTALGGINAARTMMYQTMVEENAITADGQFVFDGDESHKASTEKLFNLLRSANKNVKCIDSLVLDGMPGSTLQLVVNFENMNPFPLANHMFGHLPKNPDDAASSGALSKPLSDDETNRLREAFKKYDKDSSGAIDLQELGGMIKELGGHMEEEEIAEAMKALDTNNDGTCCFDEFKGLWSSKPGLGGYSNFTLKFLRAKLAATSAMDKGRALLSNASGFVGAGPAAGDDTVFKFLSEGGPAGKESDEQKMTMKIAVDVPDVKAPGKPIAKLKLGAKSDSAASTICEKAKELLAPMEEMMQMMQISVDFNTEGKTVVISTSPPEEAAQALYSDPEVMKMITPIIKALKNSSFDASTAYSFDDILASPDTPMMEVNKGGRGEMKVCIGAEGRNLFLDKVLLPMAPGPQQAAEVQVLSAFTKLITNVEVNFVMNWHADNLAKIFEMHDMAGKVMTPSKLREFIPEFIGSQMPAEFVYPMLGQFMPPVLAIVESLESIDSLSIENIDLPVEFAANGKPANVGVSVTMGNYKPFALISYIADPLVQRVKAFNDQQASNE